MSRIQDALKRAEEQRSSRQAVNQPRAAAPAPADRLADEVRELEAKLAAWRTGAPLPKPQASASESAPAAAAQSLWSAEIQKCEAELAAHERRIGAAHQHRAALQAQATEQERVVAQASAHFTALQQQIREVDAELRDADAQRVAFNGQLVAFRQCEALAKAAAEADESLQSHTESLARIARVQQRVNEKLSQQERQGQELRQASEVLKRQLADAVARAKAGSASPGQGGGR
jgi:chromosome segregation ATPase